MTTGRAELREVAAGVWVVQAQQYATNSTVVVAPEGAALVVDPAVSPSDLAALATAITERGWHVRAGFSTHPHWDHLLWTAALGDVPRWARAGAVAAATARRSLLLEEAAADLAVPLGADAACFATLAPLPEPGDALPWCPYPARVVGHEAHAPGHAALLLTEQRVLLAGDMLSDVEIPLLDLETPHPVQTYRAGLERLAQLIEDDLVDAVVPGHGTTADAAEARRRLDLDRRYLAALPADPANPDPRLGLPWLREAHAAQRAAVQPS